MWVFIQAFPLHCVIGFLTLAMELLPVWLADSTSGCSDLDSVSMGVLALCRCVVHRGSQGWSPHDKFHASICVLQRLVPSLACLLVSLHLPQVPGNQQNWALSWLCHYPMASLCWDDWSALHTCTTMCGLAPHCVKVTNTLWSQKRRVRMSQRGWVPGNIV